MNGAVAEQQSPYPPTAAPALILNQVTLSWQQIWAGAGTIIAAVWSAYAAGYLFVPAKDSDVKSMREIVQILQVDNDNNRKSLERLTVAVDNLSGIVDRLVMKPDPAPMMMPVPVAPAPIKKSVPRVNKAP